MSRKLATNRGILILALLLAAIMMICGSAAAQASSTDTAAQDISSISERPGPQLKERHSPYRLHKSDVVEVEFSFSPEFNQTLTVQPDGYISMQGAGQIQAENRTLTELAQAIRIAYRGILNDPAITISLKDFDKPFFLASGQVGKPGKYELRSDTTLTEALTMAGWFTDAAKHSQVVLFRRVSSGTVEARVFNVKRMVNSRNLEEDPLLSPGDMVYVPQSTWSKWRRYLPTSSVGLYATPFVF